MTNYESIEDIFTKPQITRLAGLKAVSMIAYDGAASSLMALADYIVNGLPAPSSVGGSEDDGFGRHYMDDLYGYDDSEDPEHWDCPLCNDSDYDDGDDSESDVDLSSFDMSEPPADVVQQIFDTIFGKASNVKVGDKFDSIEEFIAARPYNGTRVSDTYGHTWRLDEDDIAFNETTNQTYKHDDYSINEVNTLFPITVLEVPTKDADKAEEEGEVLDLTGSDSSDGHTFAIDNSIAEGGTIETVEALRKAADGIAAGSTFTDSYGRTWTKGEDDSFSLQYGPVYVLSQETDSLVASILPATVTHLA